MDLNLIVRNLGILENLAPQKCLIPEDKFPVGLKPGSWCKCYCGNDGNYSVCQVFPRSNIPLDYCYLDDTVCKAGENVITLQKNELLTRIEVLSNDIWLNNEGNGATKPLQITLSFAVNEELFSQNLENICLDYLLRCSLQHLPALHLTVGCKVQIEELQKKGIAAILVDNVKGANVSTSIVCVDEDSQLFVNDVQLRSDEAKKQTFYGYGFERAQQDLHDLLLVSEMLEKCSWHIRPSLNALITGETGCGKSALIRWFVSEYRCNCFCITVANVLGQYPGEAEEQLRHKFLAVKTFVKKLLPKTPTVVVIEDLQLLCPILKISASDGGNMWRISAQLLNLVDDFYTANTNIICLATSSSPELISDLARRPGRFERQILIAKPTEQHRRDLFCALVDKDLYASGYKNQLTMNLLDVVAKQTQGFVFADLELLMHNVLQRILRCGSEESFEHILLETLKQAKPTSMHRTDLSVYKPEQDFESLGGMEQLKRTLEMSIMASFKQPAAYKRFGLNLPKGILLYGPPGCAKTTIAKCIAKEANMMFIAASGAEVYSPFVGCAEKFIVKLFDTARKHTPCIIFLDEIDSLVGCRSTDSKGEVQIRILSTLLTEMDGIGGHNNRATSCNPSSNILIIGATNRPDLLDNALLRPGRFDKLIHVPAPDLEGRRAILNLHAKRMPFADDVDLQTIATRTAYYSGADICNLCNEAALQALQSDFDATVISMKDFDHVLLKQKSSLSLEQIEWYLNFERKFVS